MRGWAVIRFVDGHVFVLTVSLNVLAACVLVLTLGLNATASYVLVLTVGLNVLAGLARHQGHAHRAP